MQALYGTDITVEELREEVDPTRDALVEEFVEDALERTRRCSEQELGTELAREVERYVILQVVDHRWREHLENMDYLREGVHLRAMAQKDPLVEYRGEGQRCSRSSARRSARRSCSRSSTWRSRSKPELEQVAPGGHGHLQYQHETSAGADEIAGRGTARRTELADLLCAHRRVVRPVEQWPSTITKDIGRG